jgi:hypothetical protein
VIEPDVAQWEAPSHEQLPVHFTVAAITLPLKPGLHEQSVHAALAAGEEALAGQAVHEVPGTAEAKVPAGHAKQAPRWSTKPGLQEQELWFVLPSGEVAFWMQDSHVDAPDPPWYLPAGHFVHCVDAEALE